MGCHFLLQCMKVKSESEVAQSCPTLSDPMDCSLPGSSVHGIFQARVLEWVAIAFSGHCTPWTIAHQAPPSMGFSRQEYWSGVPLPSPIFPGGAVGKEFACHCRGRKKLRFDPWVRKILWRMKWQPTPVFLSGESQGQRSLVGYSPTPKSGT